MHLSIEGIREGTKALFTFKQFTFDALTPGYIARYFRRTDDFSRFISNWRNGQRYLNFRAIFSQANGIEMMDALALAESREDSCFLVAAIVGNDHPLCAASTAVFDRMPGNEPFGANWLPGVALTL